MPALEGYTHCRNDTCAALVVEYLAWQTGGLCFECFATGTGARLRELETVHRATLHTVPVRGANRRRRHRPKRTNPATVDLARRAAQRRLARLFPEVYDVLYAEERAARGLPPIAHPGKDHLVAAVATYEAFRAYRAAADRSEDAAPTP